ncbi:MAG TPA: DsbC family protein [Candidatus Aquabacterium excrementipullorum]|nr:DsbC family protein [Candidatus Aquabacterium excrementipullorum]
MHVSLTPVRRTFTALTLAAIGTLAMAVPAMAQNDLTDAQQSAIKQKLAQRLPSIPAVDELRPAPVAGLIEVRAGDHVFYTDAKGEYLIEGNLIETRTQRNLTEERLDEINKVDFATLPLKDAVVWKNGNGRRKLVVFADPNCGYCKHLEKSLQQVKDITVYTFIIPILGDDSKVKAENIWCLRDRTSAWRDWMLNGQVPAKSMGMCASPTQRNLAMAQKYRVNGTPAMFFEDGSRLASAAPTNVIEQRLNKASAKSGG